MQPEPVLHRHADHDTALICRPAGGKRSAHRRRAATAAGPRDPLTCVDNGR